MTCLNPPLPTGYSTLPPGHLANVVTCLEMTAPPRLSTVGRDDLSVGRWVSPELSAYRALFRLIGADWLWWSRLVMPDDQLRSTLDDANVEVYRLFRDGQEAGLLELDFRDPGQCEIAFFGLMSNVIGSGAGRFLMEEALKRAWSRPIKRLWVHTCTFDHPSALGFYQKSGFAPYARQIEIHLDPRVLGHLPRSAAPNVPILP